MIAQRISGKIEEYVFPMIQKAVRMKLIDLEHALNDLLQTGQLGTPVALRILVATPQTPTEPSHLIGLFAPMIRLIADETRGRIQARQHPSGKQLSVLWMDARGRTVSLTVVSTPETQRNLQVLVIGNQGISQLDGGEAWDDTFTNADSPLWERELAESLKRGTTITVGDA